MIGSETVCWPVAKIWLIYAAVNAAFLSFSEILFISLSNRSASLSVSFLGLELRLWRSLAWERFCLRSSLIEFVRPACSMMSDLIDCELGLNLILGILPMPAMVSVYPCQ